MDIEIVYLGHSTEAGADKIWGGGKATTPEGRKVGFRFWGGRDRPITFKVCKGDCDRNFSTITSKWFQKIDSGYREINSRCSEELERQLGSKFAENYMLMLTNISMIGVDEEAMTT